MGGEIKMGKRVNVNVREHFRKIKSKRAKIRIRAHTRNIIKKEEEDND